MPETQFAARNEEEREAIVNRTIERFVPKKPDSGTKIVVTGKGGVGKTVITAALSNIFVENGFRVLAVDGDPQMNLAPTLGLPDSSVSVMTPLNAQFDYIEEKVGVRPNSGWGLFITLNPNVDDVVPKFGIDITDRIKLLVMGTLSKASVGCLCPENTLLEATVNHIALRNNEVIIMDTEAGVEHFGRAIAKGFQHALIVTDPSYNSCSVAAHALRLARDLGIPRLHLICNKVRSNEESRKVEQFMMNDGIGFEFSTHNIPYDSKVYQCDPSIQPLLKDAKSEFFGSLQSLFEHLHQDRLDQRQ